MFKFTRARARTHAAVSGADSLGMLPAYYCELQVSVRVHAALLLSQHVETHTQEAPSKPETFLDDGRNV